MAVKKKVNKEGIVTSAEQLSSFLKTHKEDHYNYEETIEYKVSTGSLTLDIETGGGLGPGLHRFCGINEGGKTSEACLLYTSPSPRDLSTSRMPSSA